MLSELISKFELLKLIVLFFALYILVFFLLLTIKRLDKIKDKKHLLKRYRTLSVIVPAYNEEKNLEKCINSLIASDYPKKYMEIIIIDDGSKDRTFEIAKKLEKKYKGIVKAYTKKNSGKADTMNFGIAKAKGEITATLDADTIVEKDAIKKLMSHFDNGADAVTPVAKVLNKNKNMLTKLQEIEYLFTAFVRRVLQQLNSIYVTPGTFSMFRTKVLRDVGGFDPNNILEDQEMAMRLQSKNYKIEACMDAIVYTEVPETFSSLLKQRERWHRGGLRNSIKYMHLINLKYGDFGVFIIPMSLMGLALMILLLIGVLAIKIINPPQAASLAFSLDAVFLLSILLFALTLLWTYLNLSFFEDKLNPLDVTLYLITYAYFITFVWVVSLTKELFGMSLTWK